MLGLGFFAYGVILVLITTVSSLIILWLVKKLKLSPRYRLIALLPVLFLAYGLYQGFTDPYSLYEGHFEEITGIQMPETTEFIDYVNWGYGTYPAENSSLFHVKVESDFYERLKSKLTPSTTPIKGLYQEAQVRFEDLLGENFIDQIDYQYSKYDSKGAVLYVIGFIEEDHSLVVHAWKD